MEKNTNPLLGSAITVQLTSHYAELLQAAAKKANKSSEECAGDILLASLEVPSWDELIRCANATANEVALLNLELEQLQSHTEQLRVAHLATTELLLMYVGGLSDDEARAVIDELFQRES